MHPARRRMRFQDRPSPQTTRSSHPAVPTNCATSKWKSLSLSEETKAPQNREADTEEGRKTEEKKAKSTEYQRKRGKTRQRRQAVLLGEVSLPEERDSSYD